MRLLAQTNKDAEAKGDLPPSTCRPQGMTQVTCSNPSPSVTSVTFRTYASLTALYNAYVAKVESLNSGHFQANLRSALPFTGPSLAPASTETCPPTPRWSPYGAS